MKKIYVLFFVFMVLDAHAQFVFMDTKQVSGPVILTFVDGTTKSGVVKNNSMDKVIKRLAERKYDTQALKYANLHAPTIWFKEEGSSDFIKLDSKNVYKVLFLSDDERISLIETFKVKVRKLNVKKFQPVDKGKEEIYYLSKLKDGPIEIYGYGIGMKYNLGLSGEDMVIQFLKAKEDDFCVNLHGNNISFSKTNTYNIIRYAGRNCGAFNDFMIDKFINGDGYKDLYKPGIKELEDSKDSFIKEVISEGLSEREAKSRYGMKHQLFVSEFFIDKYEELCQ